MQKTLNLKHVLTLSTLVSILAIVASIGGLFIKDLYRDNAFVKSAWFTNDIITLFVVIPLMIVSLWYTRKGSMRGELVLMGMLGYMSYNYAFYLFGAAFNPFFLVYVALFTISVTALIIGFNNLQVESIAKQFSPKTPVKVVRIYILVIAVMLFLVEMSMIVSYFFTGILPETIKLTGHPTSVVFAMDLSVIIPVSVITTILLRKRNPWGYVLATMMLIKGFTYGLVLSIGTVLLAYSPVYGKWDPLMPLYVVLVIGGFIFCWMLLRNLTEKTKTNL